MSSKPLILLSLVAMLGCQDQQREAYAEAEPNQPAIIQPAAVLPERVVDVPKKVFYGQIEGAEDTQLAALKSGRVEKLWVRAGQFVTRGTVLMELYDPEANAILEQAQAERLRANAAYKNTRAEFERTEALVKRNLQTQSQLDKLRRDLDMAYQQINKVQAKLNAARNQLAELTISAPFDGIVSDLLVRQKEYAKAGQTVLNFQAADALHARFAIPEEVALTMTEQQKVEVFVPALEQTVQGQVVERALPLGSRSPFFFLKVQLETSESGWMGLNAQLQIPLSDQPLYRLPGGVLHYDEASQPYVVLQSAPEQRQHVQVVTGRANHILVSSIEPLDSPALVFAHSRLSQSHIFSKE
ncbi:efflux RND transporter periplasmic adaptor subunit [Pseudoalteromonas sp. DL2-H2.2]|uniref:efflux RND transporter periplasmic adaptor subunit n=1 Tax=Pseudoalteromonas sp. DL2-H2.2 TaxID=2908889 RepID=UPI001F3F21A6|nr:efflux RND transporter periplasmic adaptor subunit [Pseudoalteromonas sp. DL2-H2.2]MCF2911191.1 efflux RND transporter periplasmic adaptor subunit [Pseudoalteromonas sp. DL2-H2.2]